MRPVAPRGFRDVLFDEADERAALVAVLSDVASSWGYRPVQTPVVEQYALLEAAAGGSLEGTAFRLLDVDGTLLALRPEMTLPIARVVASRLASEPGPHRVRYVADVFREHAAERGQPRQFTQAGVELVGEAGPAADAEVVAVLVESLRASGLSSYKVGLGCVGVLLALLEASGGTRSWRDDVMRAAHARNLVEIDRLSADPSISSAVGEALRAIPRIIGGAEALRECRSYAAVGGFAAALDDLDETWRLLEAMDLTKDVVIDFGVMRSFDYYTGMVLEAYAPGVGLPLGGGGRYDRALAALGRPEPAAGFALGLERLTIALAEQGRPIRVRALDAVVGGAEAASVLAGASRLRAAGWRVSVACGSAGAVLVREARRQGAVEALLAEGSRLIRLDRAGELATPLEDPVPEPPTLSWADGEAD